MRGSRYMIKNKEMERRTGDLKNNTVAWKSEEEHEVYAKTSCTCGHGWSFSEKVGGAKCHVN